MCDVCIKRSRAYDALPTDEDREAVDAMAAQWMPQLSILAETSMEQYESGLLMYGESLDTMLGLTPVLVPDDMSELSL